jgi:hypothetical protein
VDAIAPVFNYQVEELIEAALDQGLDPKQLLAEAMALGLVIPAAAAAQAGIQLPSREQVGGCWVTLRPASALSDTC